MMVIMEAQSLLGKTLVKKLNHENFNYLALVSDDASFTKEWLEEIQYWHQVPTSASLNWVQENAEEIEFIVDCRPLDTQPEPARFVSLWNLGYQHHIPVIGISHSEEKVQEIISTEPAPFFWTILLVDELHDPTKVGKPLVTRVAEAIYHFIRHRQHPGIRTLEEAAV
ncbi:hypothetical protein [Tunicatimonas pelagia]|uniref:hypothetical protein n=1 Tax=Tunicatimonas pelagia TaxID=931531 RepID=UPI0026659DEA|nr:hypothetical protein [Tunicatimonas pelagia]WKN43218.1 hypothetical protein P0M28_29690 [Tunicatimonas pelagia]